MASTKALTVMHDNVTLTASAANTVATAVDLADGYGGLLHVKLTNGATGPTVAAQVQVEGSADNTNFYNLGGALKGSVANSAVSSWCMDIPAGVKYLRTTSGSNTGQNVTLRVELVEITAVS